MKLLRFGPLGDEKPGLLDGDGNIRDLSGEVADIAGVALLPESLAKLRALDECSLPLVEGAPRIGVCAGAVGKFVCAGLNYADHAAEAGLEMPSEPVLFMKATSTLCGACDDIEIPRGSVKTDWEVELGMVIGKPGRNIPEESASEHIAGYCVINDVSERDFQLAHEGQWVKGKSHDSFGPAGPWLVTADEVSDPQKLSLWLEVDGKRHQYGSTRTMVFGAVFLVSYISRFMSLQSGDIISTGTPPGVGMGQNPPVFLKAGNIVTLGIEGLGEQEHTCVQA